MSHDLISAGITTAVTVAPMFCSRRLWGKIKEIFFGTGRCIS